MFVQMEALLKNLPRPIFGTGGLELNRCKHKVYSMNMLNSGLICTRDFSSFKNKCRNILLKHKAFDWTHEQSRKRFLKRSFMTKCKLPSPNKSALAISVCNSTALPSWLSSLRSYPFNEKYFLPSLPCHHESPKILSKSQSSKTHKTSVYRGLYYPIFLHRVHWRGFHSSLFSLAKSDSNESSACTEMDKICKSIEKKTECGRPCKEKIDVCRQEKVKCDKSQRNKENVRQKPKTEKKIVDSECKKTCLPKSKCELPRTASPPKMEYAKVTCPPPKFTKPNPCPPILEHFQDDEFHVDDKQTNIRKKKICKAPLPLPKPPYAPIVLCPCQPPLKVHPGPCPCHKMKVVAKRSSLQPCPLKKKYPCPTGIHYCPSQKLSNLKREPNCKEKRSKKEKASAS